MKLKCLNEKCGRTFLYPAKRSLTIPHEKENEFDSIETHICPYCHSLSFDEHAEPQQEISSLKKASLEEADGLIKEGYVVHSVFANHCVLVKREKQ